jgi:hypothetical protein
MLKGCCTVKEIFLIIEMVADEETTYMIIHLK